MIEERKTFMEWLKNPAPKPIYNCYKCGITSNKIEFYSKEKCKDCKRKQDDEDMLMACCFIPVI